MNNTTLTDRQQNQMRLEGITGNLVTACPLCQDESREGLHLLHTTVWECTNSRCRLRFAAPPLDEAQLRAAYEKHYYPRSENAPVEIWENTSAAILKQVFGFVIRQFDGLAGKSLLDYGCGLGNLCCLASDLGMQAVGVEPDDVARASLFESSKWGICQSFRPATRTPQPPVRPDLPLGLYRTFAKPLDRPSGSLQLPEARWTDFDIYA